MDGFESQMRQMTDWNFAFYCHCILLIYRDAVGVRVAKKKKAEGDVEEEEEEGDTGTRNPDAMGLGMHPLEYAEEDSDLEEVNFDY